MSPTRGTEQLRDLTRIGTRSPGCCPTCHQPWGGNTHTSACRKADADKFIFDDLRDLSEFPQSGYDFLQRKS